MTTTKTTTPNAATMTTEELLKVATARPLTKTLPSHKIAQWFNFIVRNAAGKAKCQRLGNAVVSVNAIMRNGGGIETQSRPEFSDESGTSGSELNDVSFTTLNGGFADVAELIKTHGENGHCGYLLEMLPASNSLNFMSTQGGSVSIARRLFALGSTPAIHAALTMLSRVQRVGSTPFQTWLSAVETATH